MPQLKLWMYLSFGLAQIMVEGKLRELEYDPANVQLIIKKILHTN